MISIIITTKNSLKFIDDCIRSISCSNNKSFEIIVVDCFSADGTLEQAEHAGKKYKVDVSCYSYGPERSAQRNYGVEKSKGQHLLFLDVDMEIHPELLLECFSKCTPMREFESDLLYINETVVGKGFWIKVRNFERQFYDGTFVDCPRFIKRNKWIPFNEDLTGVEDWDWSRRLQGYRDITYFSIYHKEGVFNFWRYIKKKRYYSQWMDRYKRLYPGCEELNVFYRYITVFTEDGKWKKALQNPILMMGVILLRIAVGITYLTAKKY